MLFIVVLPPSVSFILFSPLSINIGSARGGGPSKPKYKHIELRAAGMERTVSPLPPTSVFIMSLTSLVAATGSAAITRCLHFVTDTSDASVSLSFFIVSTV